jgi:hypothetical protein
MAYLHAAKDANPMRTISNTQLSERSVTLFALAAALMIATAPSLGAAQTSATAAKTSTPPTCQALEDKCLAHVRQRLGKEKPADDGIERPHLTIIACDDSYHKAEATGVWPERLPFNFATKCTR